MTEPSSRLRKFLGMAVKEPFPLLTVTCKGHDGTTRQKKRARMGGVAASQPVLVGRTRSPFILQEGTAGTWLGCHYLKDSWDYRDRGDAATSATKAEASTRFCVK